MQNCYRRVTKIMEAFAVECEADKNKKRTDLHYIVTYPDLFPPNAKDDFYLKCEIGGWEYNIFMARFLGHEKVIMSCFSEFLKHETEHNKRPWDASLKIDESIKRCARAVAIEAIVNKGVSMFTDHIGLAYFVSRNTLGFVGFGYLPFIFPYSASQYDQRAFIRKVDDFFVYD